MPLEPVLELGEIRDELFDSTRIISCASDTSSSLILELGKTLGLPLLFSTRGSGSIVPGHSSLSCDCFRSQNPRPVALGTNPAVKVAAFPIPRVLSTKSAKLVTDVWTTPGRCRTRKSRPTSSWAPFSWAFTTV